MTDTRLVVVFVLSESSSCLVRFLFVFEQAYRVGPTGAGSEETFHGNHQAHGWF